MNNLTLLELTELVYCIHHTLKSETACVNRKIAEKLHKELHKQLEERCEVIDKLMEAEATAVQRWG